MNGNNAPNIVDLREIVRECAERFLTTVSANEIAELVAERIDGMDVLELADESESWERVIDLTPVAAVDVLDYERCGQWAA